MIYSKNKTHAQIKREQTRLYIMREIIGSICLIALFILIAFLFWLAFGH